MIRMDQPQLSSRQSLGWTIILLSEWQDRTDLIFDFAAAHMSDHVLNYVFELEITVGFIPASLTSVLQVCDILVSKSLKNHFKRQFCAWKIKNDPRPWKQELFGLRMQLLMSILHYRQKKYWNGYGQEFIDGNADMIMKHLTGLNDNYIYSSLQENQGAIEL